jgi:hypothetical protein
MTMTPKPAGIIDHLRGKRVNNPIKLKTRVAMAKMTEHSVITSHLREQMKPKPSTWTRGVFNDGTLFKAKSTKQHPPENNK